MAAVHDRSLQANFRRIGEALTETETFFTERMDMNQVTITPYLFDRNRCEGALAL
jgi:hypothetical protein